MAYGTPLQQAFFNEIPSDTLPLGTVYEWVFYLWLLAKIHIKM